MGKRLGYTFYPKDWRSSDTVYGLTLQEKGFYRELIDECFIEGSEKITINVRSFTRKHGINARTYSKLIQNLCKTSLIVLENNYETSLYVPSVCSRLGVISRAQKGGEANAKRVAESENKGELIEENRIEENSNNKELPLLEMDLDTLKSELIKSDKWKNDLALHVYRKFKLKLPVDPMNRKIDDFIIHLASDGEEIKTLKDGKTHFKRWLLIQIENR